jgi:hypothetical protein
MPVKSVAKKRSSKKTPRKWSARVMKKSDALDLQPSIFKSSDPAKIAASLKRSSERSTRKKGTPYQFAMSMLNFYINRGGKNLPASKKKILERAKGKLRTLFSRA